MRNYNTYLLELRKEAGLTQQQLGDKLNVTKGSICCYENGTRMASIETLIQMANLFRVDLDYLIGTDDYIVSDRAENYGIRVAKEEIDLLKTAWHNMYSNSNDNAVVLNNGLDFQEASTSSVEMQLDQNKRTLAEEINNILIP